MSQVLKSKLVSMLEAVYPALDCDFLAEASLRRRRTRATGVNRMWCLLPMQIPCSRERRNR
jgi:hypothetical protein